MIQMVLCIQLGHECCLLLVNYSLTAHTSISLAIKKVSKFMAEKFTLVCTKIQHPPE
jgi:hypothetical protein